MDKEQYFKILMIQLSNVLFNGSQSASKKSDTRFNKRYIRRL